MRFRKLRNGNNCPVSSVTSKNGMRLWARDHGYPVSVGSDQFNGSTPQDGHAIQVLDDSGERCGTMVFLPHINNTESLVTQDVLDNYS